MIPDIAALVVLSALVLDMAFGDPPNRYHPTAWVGRIYGKLIPHFLQNKKFPDLALGILSVTIICMILIISLFALEYAISSMLQGIFKVLVLLVAGTILLKSTIAIRGMQTHAMRVAISLESGDTKCAQGDLAMIVKRQTGNLERKHLISGTLESVSENTTDGVTGSLFYFAIFGLAGAFVYRAVNTADSMIGYKNKIFSNIGKFAALSDTVLNYLPSRLTAYVMVISALVLGLDWKNSYQTLRKCGSCTESVNAGYTMAALAGALNVTLEKPESYIIRGGSEHLDTVHIRKAISVMKTTSVIFSLAIVLPIIYSLSYIGWWIHV